MNSLNKGTAKDSISFGEDSCGCAATSEGAAPAPGLAPGARQALRDPQRVHSHSEGVCLTNTTKQKKLGVFLVAFYFKHCYDSCHLSSWCCAVFTVPYNRLMFS